MNNVCIKIRYNVLPWIIFVALFLFPHSTMAHKVTVFAWVEGNTVFTESKLNGGKRVVNGNIKVYNSSKVLLVEGKTDEQGAFSFKLPEEPPLLIELNAGMGHMAKWTIRSEDLPEDEKTEWIPKQHRSNSDIAHNGASPAKQLAEATVISKEELEVLIEDILDRKLKPIKTMLTDTHHKGPSLSEVIGGIGYIIGLMGIAAYLRYRKSNSG